MFGKKRPLRSAFNTFGHAVDIELPRVTDRGIHHRTIVRRTRKTCDHRLVNLEFINRKLPQQGDASDAGTKVINGDANAIDAQLLQLRSNE